MSCDNTEFKTVGQKSFSYSNTFICNENALISTFPMQQKDKRGGENCEYYSCNIN